MPHESQHVPPRASRPADPDQPPRSSARRAARGAWAAVRAVAGRCAARSSITLTAATAAVVVAAPLALATTVQGGVQGGVRNPGSNANVAYKTTTEIIANNDSWGTRQSNKGTGGGAIYGCRSVPGGPACIEANNINTGAAFSFVSSGMTGGTITLSNPAGAPLTTNATGVATGFNANYLQGKQASAFLGATNEAVDSAQLGGVAASSYAQGQLLYADVNSTGSLTNNRGATAANLISGSSGSYTVTFSGDVSKCSYTASPLGAAVIGGSIGVGPDQTNADAVDVNLPTGATSGFSLQVIC